MGKYKSRDYCQIYNWAIERLSGNNKRVGYATRWLYVTLCLLEHRLTGRKEDFFFRSLKQLHGDTQISARNIIRGIQKLKEFGLIQTWQMHWVDKKTGKKSEKHITAFRILEV